jgi:import receptor subunit TOM20
MALQISHSCDPCARPSFDSGNSTIQLVATRDIKAGDEITVSYVDASVRDDEDVVQARYRRRKELARGWRFACQCDRCIKEAPPPSFAGEELQLKDGSKVEPIVSQIDQEVAAQGKSQPIAADTATTVD